jgi:predicted aldo/keto reductase-like oxidoreductase
MEGSLLQKRRLGRTDLQVSVVGFGGTWISQLNKNEALKVVRRAFDLGINYFDTAKLDGDSEEKIGEALKDVRNNCILATKTASRTKGASLMDIESSLHRLRTDWLDLIQLHGIDDLKTLKKAIGPGGSLGMCKKARSEGLVNYIGITGHKPLILIKAIETNEFDTVLVPLNIVTRQALEELIPLAKDLDIGVVIMKPFSAKTSNLVTCLYQPSLSLLSDEPELKTLLGQSISLMVSNALRFILAQDISVVIPGLMSIEEVENVVEVGQDYKKLTKVEKDNFRVLLNPNHCRDCGFCFHCPQSLDIAAVLRFHTLFTDYGLRNWAKKLYKGLEVTVDDCIKCGECEQQCPYNLPIINMLHNAQMDLSF